MAYENLQLIVSTVGGEIYIAKAKDGEMSTRYRRVITNEVLSAATEWFLLNDKMTTIFPGTDGKSHSLFYTNDENKQRKIFDILCESENED